MAEPGRYPLRRWLIWQSNEEPPLTRGQLVAQALSASVVPPQAFEAAVSALDELREDGLLFPFDFMFIDELVNRFRLAAAGEPHVHLISPQTELVEPPATA
jgi:hypothetical protein